MRWCTAAGLLQLAGTVALLTRNPWSQPEPCLASHKHSSVAGALLDLAATWSGTARPPAPLGGAGGAPPTNASQQQLWQERVDVAAVRSQLGAGGRRAPVIFVPPLTGVQLEMQLDHKPAAPHFWCARTVHSWRRTWLDLGQLLPWAFDCWADNFRLECDAGGHRCREPAGVRVQPVPGFDSAMRVAPGEYFKTFAPLAVALEQLGWRRDADLLAHLYDWRLPPSEWVQPGGYFDQLQRQIEEVVEMAGRPAVAISLSMGAPYFALFLRRHVTHAWQERHIAGHVAISGAWGGSLAAPLTAVAGAEDARYGRQALRALLRALPVLAWLSPTPAVFGGKTLVRDEATGKRYRADDLGAWLRVSGATQAAAVWGANLDLMEDLASPPNSTLYCLYSTGIDTVAGVTVNLPGQGHQRYQAWYSDGDGVVPLRSLQVCDRWLKATATAGSGIPGTPLAPAGGAGAPPRVIVRRYPGLRHASLLRFGEAFAEIVQAVLELAGADVVPGLSRS